jgi:hypothetical protein
LLFDELHKCLPVPKGTFFTSPQIVQRQAALTTLMTHLKNKSGSVMSALHNIRLSGQRFISVSMDAGSRFGPACIISPVSYRDS